MTPPQAGAPNPLMLFGPLLLIWYLLLIRPESKRRKEHQGMLKNLKKNDEVVTIGGMFGTVVNIKPESVTLRVDDNVRVEVERSAVAKLARPASIGQTSMAPAER